jgi:hypothetical protein
MAIEINPSTPTSPVPTVDGISVIWLGDWNSTKVYRRNEGVFHDGSSYRANKTTSQIPSLTATDWDLLAQGAIGSGSTSGLNNLTDVTITTPADNNLLAYDSATSHWVNQTAAQVGLITSNDLTSYYTKTEVDGLIPVPPDLTVYYLKTEVDTLLNTKANQSTTYTKTETDSLLNAKPDNLTELADVVITSPTDGQSLVYDNATNKWVNETVAGSGTGESNTASNVGTAGVGIYKQKTSVDLEFKKLNPGSSKISIIDDTTNSEVDIDVIESNLTLGNLAGTLPISKGGTGSTTASAALTALGAASSTTLTSHTGNTSNPHNTTAAQVGAIATTEKGIANGVATLDTGGKIPDTQIPDAITRDSELTAHTSNTSNPHSVTAAQVGNTTAQWNANQIQGRLIHTATPTNGQVLIYSTANTRWEPQTPASGGGKVLQVLTFGSGSQISVSASTPVYAGAFGQMVITPSSTANKILIRVCLSGIYVQNNSAFRYQFVRMTSSAVLTEGRRNFEGLYPASDIVTFDLLDSPATTSVVEYGIYLGAASTSNIFLNYVQNSFNQGYTTVTLMEIAP